MNGGAAFFLSIWNIYNKRKLFTTKATRLKFYQDETLETVVLRINTYVTEKKKLSLQVYTKMRLFFQAVWNKDF